jgi:hypothetical protein
VVEGASVFGGGIDFAADVGDGLEEELAEIGESGGVATRDAFLGQGAEDLAEGVVDVYGVIEVTGEGVELGGEFFGL